MSEPTIIPGEASEAPVADELRYSLKVMIAEVRSERAHSVLSRELVDSSEIKKMFADRRRQKKKEL